MLSEVGVVLLPISERLNERSKSRGSHLSLSTHCQLTQSIVNEVILRLWWRNNYYWTTILYQKLESFIRLYCGFCGKILSDKNILEIISASKCWPGLLSLSFELKRLWSHNI